MKCQYFGDKRDLFKYDLLLDLLDAHACGRFSFIPMLTPNDGGKEGLLMRKDEGLRRSELFGFLEGRQGARLDESCLVAWRDFFSECDIEYMPYRDSPPCYKYEDRGNYFNQIPAESLKDTCLFIDPDIGIEHGKLSYMRKRGVGGADKYLFLDDLLGLSRRAKNAVFIIYQHLQFNSKLRANDTVMRAARVSKKIRRPVAFIRETDLAFLVFSDENSAFEKAFSTMKKHASKHGFSKDSVGVCHG